MKIERLIVGSRGASRDTHKGGAYQTAWKKAGALTSHLNGHVCDPFARDCPWGDFTNDINEKFNTTFNMEALAFLKMCKKKIPEGFRIVLMDPPFSDNQSEKYAKECVGDVPNFYAADSSHASKVFKAASDLLMPGGILVKLGYNTTKPAHHLELVHLYVCNLGGMRHDTLISLWKNPNQILGGIR